MEVEEAESAHPTPFLNLNGKPLFNVSTKYFSSVDIYRSKSSFRKGHNLEIRENLGIVVVQSKI